MWRMTFRPNAGALGRSIIRGSGPRYYVDILTALYIDDVFVNSVIYNIGEQITKQQRTTNLTQLYSLHVHLLTPKLANKLAEDLRTKGRVKNKILCIDGVWRL
ncbi:uncharacterized protein RCC_03440 [Ramularia collo-cygni]|uniref:Uncharacterized protein n=1 Tax=Ramularia collo-cygni TaxID=112498 RepID=A0A2D3VAW7_9PEZI|nr:uncharacterized protein RCC_03440 [Ramularia collo-cygni]CZT17603.1 uncharacterized protein RCC_03440 [Ramularia collo-cygni]